MKINLENICSKCSNCTINNALKRQRLHPTLRHPIYCNIMGEYESDAILLGMTSRISGYESYNVEVPERCPFNLEQIVSNE